MNEGTFTALQAGKMLAGAGLGVSDAFAVDRFRRLNMAGVLRPCGRDDDHPKAAYRFDMREIAAAALLFRVMDGAGVFSADDLRFVRERLLLNLDDIFADIASGGAPMLWLTIWQTPDGRRCTTFNYRMTGESDPIPYPSDDAEPMLEGFVRLAPLFERFIGANVVALKRAAN